MLKRSRALASVAIVAVIAGMGAPVWAETLQEAIALAYQTNPSLLAQRANQRALDESIVQARAGLRPRLDVTLSGSHTQSSGDMGGFDGDSSSASIGLSQTLWSGGRIGHG
ncbi:MAG: TolC family protein, partial [Brevundimonas sp.]|uniref:TolC family protein n=1 Tax=Brevundimonas sp. TaxID=1871086 RepID=UPI002AB88E0B